MYHYQYNLAGTCTGSFEGLMPTKKELFITKLDLTSLILKAFLTRCEFHVFSHCFQNAADLAWALSCFEKIQSHLQHGMVTRVVPALPSEQGRLQACPV